MACQVQIAWRAAASFQTSDLLRRRGRPCWRHRQQPASEPWIVVIGRWAPRRSLARVIRSPCAAPPTVRPRARALSSPSFRKPSLFRARWHEQREAQRQLALLPGDELHGELDEISNVFQHLKLELIKGGAVTSVIAPDMLPGTSSKSWTAAGAAASDYKVRVSAIGAATKGESALFELKTCGGTERAASWRFSAWRRSIKRQN